MPCQWQSRRGGWSPGRRAIAESPADQYAYLCRPFASRQVLAKAADQSRHRCAGEYRPGHNRANSPRGALCVKRPPTSSPVTALPMIMRWISEVPSKIVKLVEVRAVSAGRRRGWSTHVSTNSAHADGTSACLRFSQFARAAGGREQQPGRRNRPDDLSREPRQQQSRTHSPRGSVRCRTRRTQRPHAAWIICAPTGSRSGEIIVAGPPLAQPAGSQPDPEVP